MSAASESSEPEDPSHEVQAEVASGVTEVRQAHGEQDVRDDEDGPERGEEVEVELGRRARVVGDHCVVISCGLRYLRIWRNTYEIQRYRER